MRSLDFYGSPAGAKRIGERSSTDRRSDAINAAIAVLAQHGARGLTHREIDRYLDWPLGSTSNYFRRRVDIFTAIAAQIMASDLADLAIVDSHLDQAGGLSVDLLVTHVVHLIRHAMTPEQRSRSLARAEILFEAARNDEVREAAKIQIAIADALFQRVFDQLGAADPIASARFFATMMSSSYIGFSVASQMPDADQIEAIVRNWVTISLAQSPVPRRADKAGSRGSGHTSAVPAAN